MKRKTKLYLKLNLVSLFFIAVSFISMTLAWFVYSGLSSVQTEVSVKAWYIELEKGGEIVSNNITISLDDIYPGMEPMEEEIKVKNFGDSNAQIKYEITGIRIFDKEISVNEEITAEYLEDMLSHEYPVHINIDLNKRFILAKTDEATFKVSISWPLDSGSLELDKLDSEWGTKAYKFKQAEQELKEKDPSYQIKAPIKLDLKLTAEQYIESDKSNSDMAYRFGNEILFDIEENKRCYSESPTCIRTNVIDANNKVSDETVTLLPKISKLDENSISDYENINAKFESQTENWKVTTRLLSVQDILSPISKDITSSVLVRPEISDLVIGNLAYEGRMNKVLLKAINSGGLFKFLNKYSYFTTTDCYWVSAFYKDENETDKETTFVATTYDESSTQIYETLKTENCKVVPVIIANKKEHLITAN